MKGLIYLAVLLSITAMLSVSAALSPVDYEKWYDFGSVSISLIADRQEYSPGDSVYFEGFARNLNDFPISDGAVRVQIFYLGDSEEYMLYEATLARSIYLEAKSGGNSSAHFGGYWDIPKDAKPGRYAIEAYFSVDQFNLAGVSFLRGIVGERFVFDVNGNGSSLIYIDPPATTIDGKPLQLREFINSSPSGVPINISLAVVNDGPAGEADISYSLYAWDDLKGEPLYKGDGSLQMPADSKRRFNLTIPGITQGAYLVRIDLKSPKNNNILKIRLAVSGKHGKLNFIGLDHFPISKGDNVTLFAVASNSADYLNNLTAVLKLALSDSSGTFFSDSSNISLYPSLSGFEASFTADKDYYDLVLTGELSDEEGNRDSVSLHYSVKPPASECPKDLKLCPDGSKVARVLPSCDFAPCPEQAKKEAGLELAYILAALALLVLLAFIYKKKK